MKHFFKEFNYNQYLAVFMILFVPAMLRHLAYYDAYTSTGVYPSVSPESKAFFETGLALLFFLEEALLSAVIALLYFAKWEWLRFLAFGYLFDPIIDITASIYTKMTSLIFLPSFALRELVLPYALTGFLLMWLFKDVKKVWRPIYVIISGLLTYQFFVM
jgi:hypothetical protein